MRCHYCGRKIEQGALFCGNCGFMQPAANRSGGASARHDTKAAPGNSHAPGGSGAQRGSGKPRKRRTGFLSALAILAVCLSALFVILTVLGSGRQRSRAQTRKEIAEADEMVRSAIAPCAGGAYDAEAVLAVYRKAKQGVSNGTFRYARQGGNNVVIGLNGGGSYIYLPPEPSADPGAPSEQPALPQTVYGAGGRIVTIQPYCAETRVSHPQSWFYPDLAAQGIVDALSAYEFMDNGTPDDSNRDDHEVTLRFLKTLSDYSVIIWHGHGGHNDRIGSFLCTVVPYTDRHWDDFVSGLLAVTHEGTVCVTDAFFAEYLERSVHPETVVYLAACGTGISDGLAGAFLDKGFDCVMASSATISRTYNLEMERAFIAGMSGEDGTFLTSGEALSYAKRLCGSEDPYYKDRAEVILFGSPYVCFAGGSPHSSQTPAARTAAPVPVDEEQLEALAGICSILDPFSDAAELSKAQRLSVLYSGWFIDGFSMFGSQYAEAAYEGLNARMPAAEADSFVRQVLGVGIPNAVDEYSDDRWETRCSGGIYEIMGSDYNVYPAMLSAEQLGNGQLRASFALLTFDESESDIDRNSPDLVITVEPSDGYWGYTVVSLLENHYN